MNNIGLYKVAFRKDGEFRRDVVETSMSEPEIRDWYIRVNNALIVASITPFTGIVRKGEKIVRI